MEIWNVKDLPPPPVTSCKIISKEVDIRLLSIHLKDGVNFFENQQHLTTEAALLSRSIYRLKMKFRTSKDFKAVEKLNQILKTYLQMDISKTVKFLLNSIPRNYKVNDFCILSKNMIDYVLVRLQGLGKILSKILEMCTDVSYLGQQRLRLGHFWKIALLVYSIAARVFVIAKSLLKYTCELYAALLPFSSSLGNSGVRWLPDNYTFPEHLDEWLGIDWFNLNNTVIEILDDEPEYSYLNLIDDSDEDIEFCNEYVLINDEPSVNELHSLDQCLEVQSCNEPTSDAIDTINIDDTVDVDSVEVHKLKLKSILEDNYKREDDIDIGEVINLTDSDDLAQPTKKKNRKRKRCVSKKNRTK